MGFLRFVIGLVSFVIAVKIASILLAVIGFALHLIWIVFVVGIIGLIAWVIYKMVSPRRAEQV
jgi:hypothetical protein